MAEPHYLARRSDRSPEPSAQSTTTSSADIEVCSMPRTRRSTSSSTRTRTATARRSSPISRCGTRHRAPHRASSRRTASRPRASPVCSRRPRRPVSRSARRRSRRRASTTRSVRPTKKWLAPATISMRVDVHVARLGRDLRGRAELVVRGEHEQLRPRVVRRPRRTRVAGGTATAARSRPSPRCAGRRCRAPCRRRTTSRRARAARRSARPRRPRRASSAATTSSGSSRPSECAPSLPSTPRKLKRRHAMPCVGQRLEQRGDDDAAHGAAVLRVRVAQHRAVSRRVGRRGPLGFEREAVGGRAASRVRRPTASHTNARTIASSRHAS